MWRSKYALLAGGILVGGIGVMLAFFVSKPVALPSPKASQPLRVVVSFFPYAEFTRGVAGEYAQVITLVPAGVEPHDFEPTPRDMEQLYRADVVIFNGAGVDAWIEKLVPELIEHGIRVVRMADSVDSVLDTGRESHDVTGEHMGGDALDPHFWLDPVLAEAQVRRIAEVLREVDPMHQTMYRSGEAMFLEELQSLDQEYQSGLAVCRTRTLITSHDAFTYLAKRYTLEVISIAGFSPSDEPSTRRLAEITELVRAHDIRFIFFETLSSPKLAATLAREAGIGTLVLNPIEGGVVRADGHKETYMSLMRENLTSLRVALECH